MHGVSLADMILITHRANNEHIVHISIVLDEHKLPRVHGLCECDRLFQHGNHAGQRRTRRHSA